MMLRDFLASARETLLSSFTVDCGRLFQALYDDSYYRNGQLVIRVIPLGESEVDRWQQFLRIQTMLGEMNEFFTAHYDAQGIYIVVPR
jgi:hypothetical protein